MVARSLRKTLVDDATHRARDLIAYGEADWALSADEIASSARTFCDELG